MKVILNKDLAPLGEEGDVKEVAKGYFRNYLFPRGIALPYTDSTVKLFESRREQIEARKAEKRKAAASVKEKLEALSLVLTMPAGANGKLYGAVTSQTVSDELTRLGFQLERKRIELPGNTFKSVGKYKITLKLYEGASAEIPLTVQGQALKTETKTTTQEKGKRHRRSEATPAEAAIAAAPAAVAPETPVPEASAEAATASPAQG